MKVLFTFLLALFLILPAAAAAEQGTMYGTFSAIKMEQDVVEHVLTEGNDIWVKVARDYWDADFIVRISNENMTNYRSWLNGDMEYPVKVYRSQQRNRKGYTYRINTSAPFVEYWTGERLILHLERIQ